MKTFIVVLALAVVIRSGTVQANEGTPPVRILISVPDAAAPTAVQASLRNSSSAQIWLPYLYAIGAENYPGDIERWNPDEGVWERGLGCPLCGTGARGARPIELLPDVGLDLQLCWQFDRDSTDTPQSQFILVGGDRRPLAGRYRVGVSFSTQPSWPHENGSALQVVHSEEFEISVAQ